MSPVALAALALSAAPMEIDPLDPAGQQTASVACDPTACSVAWNRASNEDVAVRWVSADGTFGSLSSDGLWNGGLFGSAAWGTRRFYVAGPDGVSGDYRVFLLTTSAPLTPLDDAEQAHLDDGIETQTEVGFAVGNDFGLLAYEGYSMAGFIQVFVRRVTADGGMPDPTSTLINQGPNHVYDPRVAAQGGLFWVIIFDRIDTMQTDPYLSAFDETLAPVVDHVPLLLTVTNERSGLLAARGDHLLAGWVVDDTSVLQLSRVPLDGGAIAPIVSLPSVDYATWSWRGDAGLLALQRPSNSSEAVELDTVAEQADGGVLLHTLWSATFPSSTDISVGYLTDEQALFGFSAENDAGVSRSYVVIQGIRELGEPCSSDAGCAEGACVGGVCAGGALDAGALDAGALDADAGDGRVDGGISDPPSPPLLPGLFTAHCGCATAPAPLLLAGLLLGLRMPSRRRATATPSRCCTSRSAREG